MRFRNLFLIFIAGIMIAASDGIVSAAEKSAPSRILMLTQSAGFVHGSVKRPAGDKQDGEKKLAVSEIAMIQLPTK